MKGGNMKKINVYQIRIKVFLLESLTVDDMAAEEAHFIDSAMAKEEKWLIYHEKNQYKAYTFDGLYPIEKDGVYKKDQIYTITIRTLDMELAKYFSEVLRHHYTTNIKGLTVENRIIPQKMIEELYTLRPVLVKSEQGYWRNQYSLEEYERLLFENAVKKYRQYTGEKIEEDFQLYTSISFMNRKPISCKYKGIRLLGDKINLKISDDERAQTIAHMLLAVGLGEMNSRGYGYCNYKWY